MYKIQIKFVINFYSDFIHMHILIMITLKDSYIFLYSSIDGNVLLTKNLLHMRNFLVSRTVLSSYIVLTNNNISSTHRK